MILQQANVWVNICIDKVLRGAFHCQVLNTREILNPLFPALDTHPSCECPGRKESESWDQIIVHAVIMPRSDLVQLTSLFCKEQSFYFTSFQTCYL